ncbi:hypothetical protein CMALT430_210031 [Carnobacterium maltaromaticum]|nr:hypothetical protein CMALT430_210031 [Carnobacterium maltaromaticum]
MFTSPCLIVAYVLLLGKRNVFSFKKEGNIMIIDELIFTPPPISTFGNTGHW